MENDDDIFAGFFLPHIKDPLMEELERDLAATDTDHGLEEVQQPPAPVQSIVNVPNKKKRREPTSERVEMLRNVGIIGADGMLNMADYAHSPPKNGTKARRQTTPPPSKRLDWAKVWMALAAHVPGIQTDKSQQASFMNAVKVFKARQAAVPLSKRRRLVKDIDVDVDNISLLSSSSASSSDDNYHSDDEAVPPKQRSLAPLPTLSMAGSNTMLTTPTISSTPPTPQPSVQDEHEQEHSRNNSDNNTFCRKWKRWRL